MIQTWTSGEGADAKCENCSSIYSVKIYRLPAKDSDSFNCTVCGHLMRKWNDTRVPEFTLKTTGTIPSENT
jgi:Zn ribbon nucleic-acid-binding protein